MFPPIYSEDDSQIIEISLNLNNDYKEKYNGDVMVPEGFWEVTENTICYLCGKPYEKPLRLDATSRFSCKGCGYSLHISDVYRVGKQKTGKASKEKLKEIFEREADIRNRDIEDLSKQIEILRNQKQDYDTLRKMATEKIHHIA